MPTTQRRRARPPSCAGSATVAGGGRGAWRCASTDRPMPAPFAAFAPDAITLGSASKGFWGGLRLGWIRAPARPVERLHAARLGLDLGSPVLEQLALASCWTDATGCCAATAHRLARAARRAGRCARERAARLGVPAARGGLALWCRAARAARAPPSPPRPSGAASPRLRAGVRRRGRPGALPPASRAPAAAPSELTEARTAARARLGARVPPATARRAPAPGASGAAPGRWPDRDVVPDSDSRSTARTESASMAVSISARTSAGIAESTRQRDERLAALVVAGRPACRRC